MPQCEEKTWDKDASMHTYLAQMWRIQSFNNLEGSAV